MRIVRFASRWPTRRISYQILGGYVLILGMMLLVLILAINHLSTYTGSVVGSITTSSPRIEQGSAIARQIATTRLRVAQYLRTQAPADYNATIDALNELGKAIDNSLDGLPDASQVGALQQVNASYTTYLDTFRELVSTISKREQLYVTLLGLQTALETRLHQLQQLGMLSIPIDTMAMEASYQAAAHIQLANTEFTSLRLEPRPDSVIWLNSELVQAQLWFNILNDHVISPSDSVRELYRQINELHVQFQQTATQFMTLHEKDERRARERLDQVGTELEQRSNSILNQTLSDLNDSVFSLTYDANVAQQTLLLVLVIVAVVSILASILLTISLTNPLRQLSRIAQAIAGGDLAMRAHTTRHDEIGQLAMAFDQMTDSLQRSLETERAANEQIRLQTMQIARQTQANAVIEERQRIARELHDSVKQQLFSISLSAGAALNSLSSDPEAAREYLEHLKQASREARIEMKNLLQELVPAPLQEHRLDTALEQYLGTLCKVHHLQLAWTSSGENILPITHEHALFRASQEAIANVVRHSGACKLNVNLSFGFRTILTVEDDGCGFNPESVAPGSTGLATMRSRLERVGGTLLIDTALGRGTCIQMIVYLKQEEKVG